MKKIYDNDIELEMANYRSGELNLLDGIDCDVCKNKGLIYVRNEYTEIVVRDCPHCSNRRKIFKNIEKSGLKHQFDNYDMSKFLVRENYEKIIKETAIKYIKHVVEDDGDGWFVIDGITGVGKSHICTAIVKELINNNKKVMYISFIDLVALQKKYVSNFTETQESANIYFNEIKTIPILYIDDYMKVDIPVAFLFELINYRYANKLNTIISTEKTFEDLLNYDTAICGRIHERTQNKIWWITVKRDVNRNKRMVGV